MRPAWSVRGSTVDTPRGHQNWLVVDPYRAYLSEKYWSVGMTVPNLCEHGKCSKPQSSKNRGFQPQNGDRWVKKGSVGEVSLVV